MAHAGTADDAGAVSVVVPTYREAANVGELIERLRAVRESGAGQLELVIVDDSSDDGTAQRAREAGQPWVTVVERTGARDLSKSVMLGIERARHAVIVVMDADLSHRPEDVPRLVEALAHGAEFVVGSRYVEGGSTDARWGAARRIVSRCAAGAARSVCAARDPLSGFLCFRRETALRAKGLRPRGYKIGLELMARSGAERIVEVPIHFKDRRKGRSKLGPRQVWQFAVQLMLLGSARGHWLARLCAAGALALLVGALFGRAIGFGLLQWDDRFHFAENAMLVAPWTEGFAWFWRHAYGNLYVPVFYNFAAVLGALGGAGVRGMEIVAPDPRVLHGVQVAMHAVNTLLVFSIVRRVIGGGGRGVWAAGIGAAVFAAHPLQAESVAWLSETRGVLAALLGLAGLRVCMMAGDLRAGWKARLFLDVSALALLALGLLSKPSVAPLAVVGPLMGWCALGWRRSRCAGVGVAWLAAAAGAMVVTRLAQDPADIEGSAPLLMRPVVALDALGFYAWKLAAPFNLAPDYGRTPSQALNGWPGGGLWLLGLLVALGGAYSALRLARGSASGRWVAIGALVWLAGLSPTLGLAEFHHQNISTVADRYAYLAMIGVSIAVAGLLVAARGAMALAIGAALTLGLAVRTWDQLGHWRDDVGLWRHAVQVNPTSALAENNLGYALYERGDKSRGDVEEALAHLINAQQIRPGNPTTLTNIALAAYALGDLARAEQAAREAVAGDAPPPRAFGALGMILLALGKHAEAAPVLGFGLQAQPLDVEARNHLGLALAGLGRHGEAIEQYEFALRVRPDFAPVMYNLAISLLARGEVERAIEVLERAVAIAPELSSAQDLLESARRSRGAGGGS